MHKKARSLLQLTMNRSKKIKIKCDNVVRSKSIDTRTSIRTSWCGVSRTLSVSIPLVRDCLVRLSLVSLKAQSATFSPDQNRGTCWHRKVESHSSGCRSSWKMRLLCPDLLPANIRSLPTSFWGQAFHHPVVILLAVLLQRVCIRGLWFNYCRGVDLVWHNPSRFNEDDSCRAH